LRVALVLAALLAGCGERALEVGVGSGAAPTAGVDLAVADLAPCGEQRNCTITATHSPFTLDDVCVSPAGDLEITATAQSLAFCHCMHGCGPGIDGAISLDVANHGLSARMLVLAAVHYQKDAIALESPSVDPGLRREYTCHGEAVPWDGRIGSGHLEHLVIPQHFDVAMPMPGAYAVRVQLTVDGALRWFELGTFSLGEDANCS
jgi:hypothetical protein